MTTTTLTKAGQVQTVDLTRHGKEARFLGNYWKALVPIAVGVALFMLPVPEGLKPNAWYYFSLFAAVIVALILEPIPAAAVGLIGVTAATVSLWVVPKPADAIKWALSGFQDGTVWLIFVAFMFALGYEKTGLGRRVALNLAKRLGKRTLGLGYAVGLRISCLRHSPPPTQLGAAGRFFPRSRIFRRFTAPSRDRRRERSAHISCGRRLRRRASRVRRF
jgi:hypothetical protein